MLGLVNIERLSLDQLRVLLVVVEEGSFSGAARRLNRAQSAVTYAIQQLEQQLGVEVFDRTGYRPKLNGLGEIILEDARVILARADSLIAKAGAHSAELEKSITLTIDVMTPCDALAAILREFDAEFPTIPLKLHVEAMGEVARHVRDGVADLAVLCSLPIPPEDLTLHGIGTVTLIPVVAPTHPLAKIGGLLEPDVLREHRQIVLTDRGEASAGKDFDVYTPHTWRVSDLGAKHALIVAGLGFGHLPTHLVAGDLASGRLRRLAISAHPKSGDPLRLYCAHRPDLPIGRGLAWLIDRLKRFESAPA
jgi:DNA-binding transcriptional LysR family regulator